jgi:hypothetical protein
LTIGKMPCVISFNTFFISHIFLNSNRACCCSGVVATEPHIDDEHSVGITIVVPAYNEELRLPLMLKDTSKCLETLLPPRKLTYEVR